MEQMTPCCGRRISSCGRRCSAHSASLAPWPSRVCRTVTALGETAIIYSAIGAAYATAQSAKGISATWTRYPKFGMRALVPVVMAGIISIYGLVVGVVVGEKLKSADEGYTIHQ